MRLMVAALLAGSLLVISSGGEEPGEELHDLRPGVTLPVRLGSTLRAGKCRVGDRVVVKTTQRVPVREGEYLERGAAVDGTIVVSTRADEKAQGNAGLGIRFTGLTYRGHRVALQVRALAVANSAEVDETGRPAGGATDRQNSDPASWTTRQVGGDEVFRSGWVGPVLDSSMQPVGRADYNGVYAVPVADGAGEQPFEHALGVFSSSARGLYGFDEGEELTNADGVVRILSPKGGVVLRGGDDLLLQMD